MSKGRKFYLSNGLDMIHLAQFISPKVYWNSRFTIHEVSIEYKNIWDYLENAQSEGYTGVIIYEDDIVEFFY